MALTAEIIGVGTELLLGNTVNTDARDISEGLSALGINVYFHTVVGDNPERLKSAVDIAKSRSDIIITTGGLGPTYDDLTKQTLAQCFGKPLIYNDEIAQGIRDYFASRGFSNMTENNMQQAMLPEGCVIFRNGNGTAPGCGFEAGGKHVLMLPGPPSECKGMFDECAVPYLKRLTDDGEIFSHNIHIFGRGESDVEDQLRPMMKRLENPTLAPYAGNGEVKLRLTARAATREEAETLMAPVLKELREELGDVVYGVDVNTLEETVIGLLKEAGKTLATAESCTGGLISKRLTDISGASAAYMGGVIAYSNDAKRLFLNVDGDVLENEGAVSDPVARQMAAGARAKLGTDLALGVTGIAGPGSDGTEKPVGLVYIALGTPEAMYCKELTLGNSRARNRLMSANYALDMVRRYLTGLPV